MRQVFVGQTFDSFDDRDSGAVFEDMDFRGCMFQSCLISVTRDPRLRSVVRNVVLVDCEQAGSSVKCAAVEDVVVDGLKTNKGLMTWAAAFKHVTLRGKIGSILLSDLARPGGQSCEEKRATEAFKHANRDYYAHVDWALDISEAEFKIEPDIRGVPARLIRRDPETQVVVTRERALTGVHKDLPFPDSLHLWGGWIDNHFSDQEYDDLVLVAPKRSRQFKDLLEGIKLLRKAGVAEPD
jgi:hypothetical protein